MPLDKRKNSLKIKTSVILPTYNEKDNIVTLINVIKKILKNIDFEIIVVDDNSFDKTGLICKKIYSKNKNKIKIIINKTRLGLSKSIYKGIVHSTKDIILVMDTDFTHNPNLILKMLKFIRNNHIVSGSRYCKGGKMEDFIHSQLSFYYNKILKFILKTKVHDNLGGFFCIKKIHLKVLPTSKIFFGYGEYFFRLLYFAKKKNFLILEIPTIYKKRTKGRSKSRFIHMFFNYFFEALKLRINN